MDNNITSGIYKITNKVNNRKYIGLAKICFGDIMDQHIKLLNTNNHPNWKLQDDFNIYGATAFTFQLIEAVVDISNMDNIKKRYINEIDINNDYNFINNIIDNGLNIFKKYINDKWLVPIDINKKDLYRYKIFKLQDKREIISMTSECLINDFRSKISFNKCIRLMRDVLGYNIKTSKITINGKQIRYKLIVGQNEDAVISNE